MNFPFEGSTLLVGEGDFSFSVALVKFIPHKYRNQMISTSLETEESILKHKTAMTHIGILKQEGVTVYLETDATEIHNNPLLKDKQFDRIIFNFPHSGGKSNHKKNRKLLSDFFCSAVQLISKKGQILMSLCKGQGGTPADCPMRAWHDSWQVVSMAANASLILKEVWPFVATYFPEYACTGFRSQDKGFNTEGAITHVFQKSEAVSIPKGDNPTEENNYILDRVNRNSFEEENHPITQIFTTLEASLQRCFHLKKHYAPKPVLDECNIGEMISALNQAKSLWSYLNSSFYTISEKDGTLRKSDLEKYKQGMMKSNNLEDSSKNEDCKAGNEEVKSRNCDETSPSGQIIQQDAKEVELSNCVKAYPSGEIIHNDTKRHLRFSMLENVKYLFDEISSNEKTQEVANGNMLCLHLMAGQVCKPCEINTCTFPVKTEILGFIQLKNSNCLNEDIVSVCEKLISCFNLSFPKLDISLDKEDSLNITETNLSEVATVKLTMQNQTEVTVGHVWLHSRAECTKSLIFVLDLSLIAILAFKLPHISLLFSENIDFSKHFLSKGDNLFTYRPVSLFPVCFDHDMSFWENENKPFDENLFFDVIRHIARDSIMSVKLIDSYICETSGRTSRCYRLRFQSHDKALSYNLSWKLQSVIRLEVARILEITLR